MGPAQTSRSSQLRVVVVLLLVGCFALGAAITGAVLYVRHVFQTTLVNVAKASGIRLTIGEVNWGLGFVQLFDSRFELVTIPGVSGTVRRIDVDFSGLSPKRLLLSKVAIQAKGDPVSLYRELTAYAQRLEQVRLGRSSSAKPPTFEFKNVSVSLESTHPFIPHVVVTELQMARQQGKERDEIAISAATTRIGTTQLGPLGIAFREYEGGIQLGFGKTLAQSQWVLGARETALGPALAFALQPIDANVLFARLGAPVPEALAKARLSGTATFALDSASGKGVGKVELDLHGFVPPHPAELRGYAFSDETRLETTFETDPLFTVVSLPILRIDNGEFHLLGNGRLERQGLVGRLLADLSTELDCVTLAKGYARSDVGGKLGAWAAKNARRAVQGRVSVRVQLDATTNDLENAKIVKRLGVGCGLRPLTLEDLLSLGLPPAPEPKAVERLTRMVTESAQLPTLPSLLPSIDDVLDAGASATKRARDALQPKPN